MPASSFAFVQVNGPDFLLIRPNLSSRLYGDEDSAIWIPVREAKVGSYLHRSDRITNQCGVASPEDVRVKASGDMRVAREAN